MESLTFLNMFLLSLPVFVLSYLAGRLTEDLGWLFGFLGLLLAIILLLILIPPGEVPSNQFVFWWLMVFFGFIPRSTIVVVAGVGGYLLGERHRPPPD